MLIVGLVLFVQNPMFKNDCFILYVPNYFLAGASKLCACF